ncbi:MAG: type IIL restriction-modification enzyme MmeI [Sulfurimonadaceae bacterium]
MALSWNEIKSRAINFSKEWESEAREHANYPTHFKDRKRPDTFIVVPSTTSENRAYIPIGRLKSDSRYSKDLVYNNYPFPKHVSQKNKETVEQKAQEVLDIRAEFTDASLADLYDPLAMPPRLKRAHQELDKAVDKRYTTKTFKNDKERIEFLFALYEEYLGE